MKSLKLITAILILLSLITVNLIFTTTDFNKVSTLLSLKHALADDESGTSPCYEHIYTITTTTEASDCISI